jgi:hypothetical protein
MWVPVSDERTGLSFTTAAGPRQSSHSRVRVPYFTVSDSILPFSSPPTTRRATVGIYESESCITTDGQLANLSSNKAPVWGLGPYFYYCQTVADLLMWGALSDDRTGLPFTIAPDPLQRIFGSESRGTRDHILLSQIRDFPFRRLLRLARSRCRYWTPLQQGRT